MSHLIRPITERQFITGVLAVTGRGSRLLVNNTFTAPAPDGLIVRPSVESRAGHDDLMLARYRASRAMPANR